jgi:hypothetical protein
MVPARTTKSSKSVRSAVKRRGRACYNLWWVWSPKTGRDWQLDSDPKEAHWVWLESNPDVVSFELGPWATEAKGDGESESTPDSLLEKVDAIVRFRDGHIEWRTVRHRTEISPNDGDPPPVGTGGRFSYVTITDADLEPHALLIRNFRDVIAAQLRTADFPPVAQRRAIKARLREEGPLALSNLLDGQDPAVSALTVSAAFSLLSSGDALSNLDVARLSSKTQLWLRE